MSNDKQEVNIYERLWKLWAMICKMVMDGVRDPYKIAEALQVIVEEVKTYLNELFSNLPLDATDGTKTFQSSGLFAGGVYGTAVPDAAKGKARPATQATVWEMILNGIFALIFGSLSASRKRWSEHQVVEFCEKHRAKLRTGGYATFFEMEGDVVARVCFGGRGRLEVRVDPFSFDYVWHAEDRRRFVSLQQ